MNVREIQDVRRVVECKPFLQIRRLDVAGVLGGDLLFENTGLRRLDRLGSRRRFQFWVGHQLHADHPKEQIGDPHMIRNVFGLAHGRQLRRSQRARRLPIQDVEPTGDALDGVNQGTVASQELSLEVNAQDNFAFGDTVDQHL